MAGNSGSKIKILKILEILRENSDEEHPLTATEIVAMLGAAGYSAERKAIYNDIDLLIDYGFDVIKNPAPKKGYYLGERDFQLAEVRLLIDAIESAQFVTERKTAELREKLEQNLSIYQRDALHRVQVYVDHRNKNANERIYYGVDELARAIEEHKMVSVHYIKRLIEAGERPKNEEHIHKLTPYALIWHQDHYYLVANKNTHEGFMHLRIDKITKVTVLEEEGRPLSEVSKYTDHFDAADYLSTKFNMFSGEPERVEIRCKNSSWQIIADRFGENVQIIDRDDETFTISANAVTSGLDAWVMQWGADMQVLKPEHLRQTIKEKIEEMQKAYEK